MNNFLNFTTQVIAILGTIFTLIITILINWTAIRKSIKHDDFSSFRNAANSIARRKFLIEITTVIGLGTWLLSTSTYINTKIKKILLSFSPNSDMLVVNKKTGVIHHKIFCKNHLPKDNNINHEVTINTQLKFHKTKKIKILSQLTQNTSAENAIEILLLATENNFTSVHLYDKLIKLLGQLKRYESIHLLLADAENKLIYELKSKIKGTKEYRKYIKALSHIQLQKNKTLKRARYRALKS